MADKGISIEQISSRALKKHEIFDILDSPLSNSIMGVRYGKSHSTISKIRRGVVYQKWFIEYHQADQSKREQELAKLENVYPRQQSGAYYRDSKYLRISVDDLLITINLSKKSLSSVGFNTNINSQRLDYRDVLELLKEKKILQGYE